MQAAPPILVIEDEEAIQDLLADSLSEAGFEVTKASSSEEAIKLLDAPDRHFRALITDIDLKSKLTGWEVARHARKISPELPVIYATGTPNDWESMGVPNSILVAKPYAPAQIVTAVSQLLNMAPTGQT